jgi:hypothetical protein
VALYHFTTKVISRDKVGRSVVAAVAYRARECLRDERAGRTWDYRRRRDDLARAELLLPARTCPALQGREALWNAVEARERRADARLAREFELALPRELSLEQQLALVREWAFRELVARWDTAVDLAVHVSCAADGSPQPHAHLLATDRPVGPGGFGPVKIRAWNQRSILAAWRASWADACNAALAAAGHAARIDHRSYAARGLPLMAEAKLGPAGTALEARGVRTSRGDLRRAARAHNAWAANALAECGAAAPEAVALGTEAAAAAVAARSVNPSGFRSRWSRSLGVTLRQPQRRAEETWDGSRSAIAQPQAVPWAAGAAGCGGRTRGEAHGEPDTSANPSLGCWPLTHCADLEQRNGRAGEQRQEPTQPDTEPAEVVSYGVEDELRGFSCIAK